MTRSSAVRVDLPANLSIDDPLQGQTRITVTAHFASIPLIRAANAHENILIITIDIYS
jgi:hypothetical protein